VAVEQTRPQVQELVSALRDGLETGAFVRATVNLKAAGADEAGVVGDQGGTLPLKVQARLVELKSGISVQLLMKYPRSDVTKNYAPVEGEDALVTWRVERIP
jgi:hypothetical protein